MPDLAQQVQDGSPILAQHKLCSAKGHYYHHLLCACGQRESNPYPLLGRQTELTKENQLSQGSVLEASPSLSQLHLMGGAVMPSEGRTMRSTWLNSRSRWTIARVRICRRPHKFSTAATCVQGPLSGTVSSDSPHCLVSNLCSASGESQRATTKRNTPPTPRRRACVGHVQYTVRHWLAPSCFTLPCPAPRSSC